MPRGKVTNKDDGKWNRRLHEVQKKRMQELQTHKRVGYTFAQFKSNNVSHQKHSNF